MGEGRGRGGERGRKGGRGLVHTSLSVRPQPSSLLSFSFSPSRPLPAPPLSQGERSSAEWRVPPIESPTAVPSSPGGPAEHRATANDRSDALCSGPPGLHVLSRVGGPTPTHSCPPSSPGPLHPKPSLGPRISLPGPPLLLPPVPSESYTPEPSLPVCPPAVGKVRLAHQNAWPVEVT